MLGRGGAHQKDRHRRVGHQLHGDAAQDEALEAATAVARDDNRHRVQLIREVQQSYRRTAVPHGRFNMERSLSQPLPHAVKIVLGFVLLGNKHVLVRLGAHGFFGPSPAVHEWILGDAREREGESVLLCELRGPWQGRFAHLGAVERHQ
jgi:hypothetical protein